jgi:hypothetical protein
MRVDYATVPLARGGTRLPCQPEPEGTTSTPAAGPGPGFNNTLPVVNLNVHTRKYQILNMIPYGVQIPPTLALTDRSRRLSGLSEPTLVSDEGLGLGDYYLEAQARQCRLGLGLGVRVTVTFGHSTNRDGRVSVIT